MKRTYLVATNMTVATTKVGAIMIITPSHPLIHLHDVMVGISAGPVAVNLLEDYSYVEAAKSAITPLESNRQLAGTSDLILWGYPDITAVAGAGALTVASVNLVAATQVPQKVGTKPIVLKPSSSYLLAFTNSNAGNAVVNFELAWEE